MWSLSNLIRAIRAPFDAIRSRIWGIASIRGRMRGDIARLKALPHEIRGEAARGVQSVRQAKGDARALRDRASGAVQGRGQAGAQQAGAPPAGAQPQQASQRSQRKRMGLFSGKKKCPGCRQKLHPSWDQCPYCGAGVDAMAAQAAPAPAAAPAEGGRPRTMALEARGGGGDGGGLGWLVPLEGPQTGELFQLRGRAVVGSAPDCDVVLRDPSVSGRHAEFVHSGAGFRLTDLGSTNGTFVNDKRVSTAELVDNDSVRLGRTSFKFKAMS